MPVPTVNRFDGMTGALVARAMASMNADMEQAALRMVEPRKAERFLVVGFGPGVGLEMLLDAAPSASVLGLDPSKAMVGAARRRLARHSRGDRVELLPVAADRAPADGDFDAVVSVNSEQLWAPHLDSLVAVAKALRPGGRLVSLTHAWAITKHCSLPEWRAMVESDLVASGLEPPRWTEGRFRSGPALGYRADKPMP